MVVAFRARLGHMDRFALLALNFVARQHFELLRGTG